jgi:hypothetical protein
MAAHNDSGDVGDDVVALCRKNCGSGAIQAKMENSTRGRGSQRLKKLHEEKPRTIHRSAKKKSWENRKP